MSLNMTEGKPLRLMLRFSLPLLLANILQLLYTMADSAVVGRLLGVNAFASVGAAYSLYWLVMSAVIGISHGFGTVFAHRFGAGDPDGLRRAFSAAAFLTAAIGACIALAGVFGCVPALKWMDTPPELLDGSAVYLYWLLGGMPVTLAYNLLGAVLLALGDGKTPLRAMIFSTLLNIVLDVALVIPMGIAGVALATLLAQCAAFVFCAFALCKTGALKGIRARWDGSSARELLRLGLPLGFRNAVIEVGGLVVQRYVNQYGTDFVAGIAAAKRMYSLLLVAGGAVEAAVATFVAQNFGARKFDRVKRGVTHGLRLMLMSAAVFTAFTLLFGRSVLALLIEGEPGQIKAVFDAGMRQLSVLALGLPVLHILFLYRSALQGIGNTLIPMLSGFSELILRIASVLLLTPFWGEWGVLLSDAAGWVAAAVLLSVSYFIAARGKA